LRIPGIEGIKIANVNFYFEGINQGANVVILFIMDVPAVILLILREIAAATLPKSRNTFPKSPARF
jgi:hypothetical protein